MGLRGSRIDAPSVTAVTHEAWLRRPTTMTKPLHGVVLHSAFYAGNDNAVHLWFWNGSSWADQTLGGTVLGGTSPSAYTSGTDHYCYFVGADNAVHLWFWNGSSWADQTRGGTCSAAPARRPTPMGPTITATSWGTTTPSTCRYGTGLRGRARPSAVSSLRHQPFCLHRWGRPLLLYVGNDNAVHLWFWNGSSWADQTLGGTVLGGTSPSAYTSGTDHYCYFVGNDNAVHLWLWNGSSSAAQTLGGKVLPGTSPSAYTDGANHDSLLRGERQRRPPVVMERVFLGGPDPRRYSARGYQPVGLHQWDRPLLLLRGER